MTFTVSEFDDIKPSISRSIKMSSNTYREDRDPFP